MVHSDVKPDNILIDKTYSSVKICDLGSAMDVDDGNLMDALMKTVARGRRSRVEWSGMEIAAITKPRPIQQPVLLPNLPQPVETDLEIVQIDLGGGAVGQVGIQRSAACGRETRIDAQNGGGDEQAQDANEHRDGGPGDHEFSWEGPWEAPRGIEVTGSGQITPVEAGCCSFF